MARASRPGLRRRPSSGFRWWLSGRGITGVLTAITSTAGVTRDRPSRSQHRRGTPPARADGPVKGPVSLLGHAQLPQHERSVERQATAASRRTLASRTTSSCRTGQVSISSARCRAGRTRSRTRCRSIPSIWARKRCARFGFHVGGYPHPDDINAEAVHLHGFRVTDPSGEEQAARKPCTSRPVGPWVHRACSGRDRTGPCKRSASTTPSPPVHPLPKHCRNVAHQVKPPCRRSSGARHRVLTR